MLEPDIVNAIRRLKALGHGTRSIGKLLELDRKTVRRWLDGPVERKQVREGARRLKGPDEALARELFEGVAEGNAVVVVDELRTRGVEVSARTVQRVVAPARQALAAATVATLRFESGPGEQMQVDFGQKRVVIDGVPVLVHLMAAVLGYSRRLFVKAFLVERSEDWRDGILSAWRHFGGVTRVLLVDNSRCLVLQHDVEKRHVTFHPGLVALARDCGAQLRACAPYRARTKGKVESGVQYVKRNALAGRSFASFAELEQHLSSWMERVDGRVHGTTNEVPRERFRTEAAALLPLPSSSLRVRGERRRITRPAVIVHRLDRETCGLVVFGKHQRAADALMQRWNDHERRYAAIVSGVVVKDEATVRSRLVTNERLDRHSTNDGSGEEAITHYTVVRRVEGATLLDVVLETGRRNQIRVHLAEQRHPILGDDRYGGLQRHRRWDDRHLALQARTLAFPHPRTKAPLSFELPLPAVFTRFLGAVAVRA